ncbi:ERCC4-type nuclease [Aciduliprofundum sp. MAR08-339]|uniref:ERCC4 domain-containing protein n=1 Tax=Aciduliprofundum sp. (strain MAR08-339) TaxID=673860 RepID=UPI0002A480A3|nr:ERCC4-type nuclease [Aciduliprofundum sp. MAR08-339]
MRIFVDYREHSVISLLESVLGKFEMVNLPVGDFLICDENGVLIERKSARDFLSSMKTNRLWDQMRRLLADEVMDCKILRRALLIHGSIEDELHLSGFGWNHVMGAFMEIQFKHGIPIFHAESDEALVEFFRILIKREGEGKNDGEIERRWERIPPKKSMSEEEWKVYALSSLPYIGEKMARKLLAQFGSIEKIARANIVELKKVEGIGEKKAKQIYRIFH